MEFGYNRQGELCHSWIINDCRANESLDTTDTQNGRSSNVNKEKNTTDVQFESAKDPLIKRVNNETDSCELDVASSRAANENSNNESEGEADYNTTDNPNDHLSKVSANENLNNEKNTTNMQDETFSDPILKCASNGGDSSELVVTSPNAANESNDDESAEEMDYSTTDNPNEQSSKVSANKKLNNEKNPVECNNVHDESVIDPILDRANNGSDSSELDVSSSKAANESISDSNESEQETDFITTDNQNDKSGNSATEKLNNENNVECTSVQDESVSDPILKHADYISDNDNELEEETDCNTTDNQNDESCNVSENQKLKNENNTLEFTDVQDKSVSERNQDTENKQESNEVILSKNKEDNKSEEEAENYDQSTSDPVSIDESISDSGSIKEGKLGQKKQRKNKTTEIIASGNDTCIEKQAIYIKDKHDSEIDDSNEQQLNSDISFDKKKCLQSESDNIIINDITDKVDNSDQFLSHSTSSDESRLVSDNIKEEKQRACRTRKENFKRKDSESDKTDSGSELYSHKKKSASRRISYKKQKVTSKDNSDSDLNSEKQKPDTKLRIKSTNDSNERTARRKRRVTFREDTDSDVEFSSQNQKFAISKLRTSKKPRMQETDSDEEAISHALNSVCSVILERIDNKETLKIKARNYKNSRLNFKTASDDSDGYYNTSDEAEDDKSISRLSKSRSRSAKTTKKEKYSASEVSDSESDQNKLHNVKKIRGSSRLSRNSSSPSKAGKYDEDDPGIIRMKKLVTVANLQINNYSTLWKGCKTVESKINRIVDFLKENGLKGSPSAESCKKLAISLKKKKEGAKLEPQNIIDNKNSTPTTSVPCESSKVSNESWMSSRAIILKNIEFLSSYMKEDGSFNRSNMSLINQINDLVVQTSVEHSAPFDYILSVLGYMQSREIGTAKEISQLKNLISLIKNKEQRSSRRSKI